MPCLIRRPALCPHITDFLLGANGKLRSFVLLGPTNLLDLQMFVNNPAFIGILYFPLPELSQAIAQTQAKTKHVRIRGDNSMKALGRPCLCSFTYT